jgi:uncharacterized protein YjbJ (UPF0337 family)
MFTLLVPKLCLLFFYPSFFVLGHVECHRGILEIGIFIDGNILKIHVMDTLEIEGRWNEIKGKVKKNYGKLTHNNMVYWEGRGNELFGLLQQKAGKTRTKVMGWVK